MARIVVPITISLDNILPILLHVIVSSALVKCLPPQIIIDTMLRILQM